MERSLRRARVVYELQPDSDRYHDLAFVDDANHELFMRFDGSPLADVWRPVPVTAADEDDELAQFGDYALLGTIPVFSGAAISALRPLLERNGELLPLIYTQQDFFAYNLSRTVDAMNESSSTMTRLASGRIMSVEHYVFHTERLDRETIFKLPQLPRAYVFVTDLFVEIVRAARLSGFVFRAL